jgi:hypothetical protein
MNGKGLRRINLMLSADVLGWLDQTTAQIWETDRARISRSELVRALLGALADWKLQPVHCRTESAVRGGFFQYLDRLAEKAELAKKAGS